MNLLHNSLYLLMATAVIGCTVGPEGLAESKPAKVKVKLDFAARPLPVVPLPNDLATRYDATSATKRRLNASMVAPTGFERRTRELVDQLDGWGVFAPITVPFDGAIDPLSVRDRHIGDDFAFANDAVYVVDITKGSPTYGKPAELDIGGGNFPVVVEQPQGYWKADPRGDTNSILYEEHDEDSNNNGQLDEGEDTDLDGTLDKPNYLPGVTKKHTEMTLSERADALMTFYEKETNTLIVRPLIPLRQRTTYAVVVTRRVLDQAGSPVGSSLPWIHHLGQTEALTDLPDILAAGKSDFGNLQVDDIAFAWTFTTASIEADLTAARDGLYGRGAQKHFADQYPPEANGLLPLFDGATNHKYENKYTVSGESFETIAQLIVAGGLVGSGGPVQQQRFEKALKYVDRHFFGTYDSPQLFARKDKDGNYLGYNDMSWPADVHSKPLEPRRESVTFWGVTPRKELTPDGKPKGIVILGHGYTGSKTETFNLHHYFSRMGMAVIAIDNVSHGFVVDKDDEELLKTIFAGMGVGGLADALTTNRSWDHDLDGMEDSAADFWTAYTFHTRDVVRQTAVDYVQLIRMLRGFDGQRKWKMDLNGNGQLDDIAGDLDGDGTVDVGGATMPIYMLGGSLGGIMSAVMGGLDPELTAIVPVAGGGGLIDVGVRSIQGGVREAVTLRLMGPLYVGVPDYKTQAMSVRTIVPSLNDDKEVEVASLPAETWSQLKAGDTVRADNLSNDEYDCAVLRVDPVCQTTCLADAGVKDTDKASCGNRCLTFRMGLASDITFPTQRHRLRFYQGNAFVVGKIDPRKHRACEVKADAKPLFDVDQFEQNITFHHRSAPLYFGKGQPLAPLAEGMGLHRARPELRRFLGFAQMVLDPADPAIWAKHFADADIQTHAIVLNTTGDMNVPVSTGSAIGRAAGLLDWKKKIPEWGGRTVLQVVNDTYINEAVDKIPRFVDSKGVGVLFDVENLSASTEGALPLPPLGQKVQFSGAAPRGKDGFEVYRLDPPLRTHAIGPDKIGGISGTFYPFVEPGGKHGFWDSGQHTDFLLKQCRDEATTAGTDPAVCDSKTWFDHGTLIMHAVAKYLASGGKVWSVQACMSQGDCGDVMAPPAPRPD